MRFRGWKPDIFKYWRKSSLFCMLWNRSSLRLRSIKSATLFACLVESSFLIVNNRIFVLRAKNRAWHLCGLEAVGQPNPVAFRLPCQNPLADMDPSSQIWTPLQNFPVKHRLNHIWLLVLFASFLSLVSYRFMTFLDNCKISLTNFTIIQTGSSDDLQSPPQPFCPPNYLLFKYLIY